jgi:hypothetical protein
MNNHTRRMWRTLGAAGLLAAVVAGGCYTPSAHTTSRNYSLREDLPVDPPGGCGEDRDYLEGGRLYKQYCGSCHNARPLSERPFSNNDISTAHMREQAYLTGREYRQIVHFLRRWHDLGPPTPDVAPSPKRLVFPQPISELRDGATPAESKPAPAAPQP